MIRSSCLALSCVLLLVLAGCASGGDAPRDQTPKDDDSWRTASQRVGNQRPIGRQAKKRPAPAAETAGDDAGEEPESAEEPGSAGEPGSAEEPGADRARLKAMLREPIDVSTADVSLVDGEYVRWTSRLPELEKVKHVDWEYNQPALQARIQGVVVLDLRIDEGGDVIDVEVIKSLPMGLTEEAVEAARFWRYRPVTLDGEPTKVVKEVTINFRLR